jgi:hypothetical protein
MRERPNRMVSKTIVAQVTLGSNPSPSATELRSPGGIHLRLTVLARCQVDDDRDDDGSKRQQRRVWSQPVSTHDIFQ